MALIAEEIVEEWLNRQGYFTIRGIKLGNDEIDLLAVKQDVSGIVKCRHIEVQASMRPVSYISKVPKEKQKKGKAANNASRSEEELSVGVEEWVQKKFRNDNKKKLMQRLWHGEWSSELVLHNVKTGKDKIEKEVELIKGHGIKIIRLKEIIASLAAAEFPMNEKFPVKSAAGADFIDLILMDASTQKAARTDC